MRHLRDTDGTTPHRRACQYHVTKCQAGTAPLHKQLAAEGDKARLVLKDAARNAEDAGDAATAAGAMADSAEIALENALRDLLADCEKADREEPALFSEAKIFPGGLGEMIDPEGEKQLTVMPAFVVRLAPFTGHPALSGAIAKVTSAQASFTSALAGEQTADEAVETADQGELDARTAVREQLESAYGQLKAFYKARPSQAERFFARNPGPKKKKPAAAPSPPAPTPATPATP
jgi:hypothetical protein